MYEKPANQESNESFEVGDEIVLTEKEDSVKNRDGSPAKGYLSVEEFDEDVRNGSLVISEEYPEGTKGVITLLPENKNSVHVKLEGSEKHNLISIRKIKRLE